MSIVLKSLIATFLLTTDLAVHAAEERVDTFIIQKLFPNRPHGASAVDRNEKNGITLECINSSTNKSPTFNQVNKGEAFIRLFQRNQILIYSSSNQQITKVVFEFNSTKTAFKKGEYTVNTGNYSVDTYTWTGMTDSICLTNNRTTTVRDKIEFKAVYIYHTTTETPTPTIKEFTSIGQLKQATSGEQVKLHLNNAKVIYTDDNTAYITDQTGLVSITNKPKLWRQGMLLNGQIEAKYQPAPYAAQLQTQDTVAFQQVTASDNTENLSCPEVKIVDLSQHLYQKIRINNVSSTDITLHDLFHIDLPKPANGALLNVQGYIIPNHENTASATPYIIAPTHRYDVEFVLNDRNENILSPNVNNIKVKLHRILLADIWNTVCFPFSLSEEQIQHVLGEVHIREFEKVENETFYFQDCNTIEGGKPYLLKPKTTITDPSFEGVQLVDNPQPQMHNGYGFIGTLNPYSLIADGTQLFLNNGQLKKPTLGNNKMPGMRAYFVIPSTVSSKNFSIDAISTSIPSVKSSFDRTHIYRLDGSPINKSIKQLPQGLYIINNKKIIIQ